MLLSFHNVFISDVKNVTGLKYQNHLSKESWESFDYDPSRLYKLVEDHGKKPRLLFFKFSCCIFPFRQEAAAADRQVEDEKCDRAEKSLAWRTQ